MTLPTRSNAQALAARPAPAAARHEARTEARPTVEVIMPDQYADRRAEPRFQCDARGAMLFLSNEQMITCRILDQSASGARVAMENLDTIPSEIWLFDLDAAMAKRGSAAWTMANRMGLKFNFIQKMPDNNQRPAKIPANVHAAWVKLTNPEPQAPDDDVLYFD
ncbi:MAG: hypothetical protein QM647_13320 [Asticcacaulis sp.]|uniref:hypothetical protein n=1 Tax=Asticcacaulis sp. TaxID=1872648 RepID=UPI0039E5FCFA